MTTKVEFAVDMTCEKCVKTIKSSLSDLNGIGKVDISLDRGTVVVETNLPYSVIQERIENSGKRAVLKGIGENTSSAVAMLDGAPNPQLHKGTQGVVRFIQSNVGCIVDGTIDGLTPGAHGLHVHECGDISNGCSSVGDHFNPYDSSHGGPNDDIFNRHIGDLGNVVANESGRATFRFTDKLLNVTDILGRSLVITDKADDLGKGNSPTSKIDGNSGFRIACGIIARSSGIFENVKKICACDGKTLWDERDQHKGQVPGYKL